MHEQTCDVFDHAREKPKLRGSPIFRYKIVTVAPDYCRILREEECNFLCNLSREEFMELRTLMVDMVLATDMSSHFQQVKSMKNYVVNSESA